MLREAEVQLSSKIYTGTDEKDMWQLHEYILKKQANKYSAVSTNANCGILVTARLVSGELEAVVKVIFIIFKLY